MGVLLSGVLGNFLISSLKRVKSLWNFVYLEFQWTVLPDKRGFTVFNKYTYHIPLQYFYIIFVWTHLKALPPIFWHSCMLILQWPPQPVGSAWSSLGRHCGTICSCSAIHTSPSAQAHGSLSSIRIAMGY